MFRVYFSIVLIIVGVFVMPQMRFDLIPTAAKQSQAYGRPMKYYIDKNGNKVIDGDRFLSIERFSQGLAYAITEKNEGVVIDKNGSVVIGPLPYIGAPFSEGFSAINDARTRGYLNRTGRIVIETDFDRVYNFSEGIALGVKKDSSFFIDQLGKITKSFGNEVTFESCGGYPRFSDGVIAFRDTRSGLCGYANKNWSFIVAPQFENAAPFSEGLGRVSIIRDRRELVGFIDAKGNYVIQPTFDVDHDFEMCSTDFSDGVASVIDTTSLESFYYINQAGETVMSPNFYRSESFHDGLALVFDSKMSKWGYIDRTGKLKIPIRFDMASEFSDGLAAVTVFNEQP